MTRLCPALVGGVTTICAMTAHIRGAPFTGADMSLDVTLYPYTRRMITTLNGVLTITRLMMKITRLKSTAARSRHSTAVMIGKPVYGYATANAIRCTGRACILTDTVARRL